MCYTKTNDGQVHLEAESNVQVCVRGDIDKQVGDREMGKGTEMRVHEAGNEKRKMWEGLWL